MAQIITIKLKNAGPRIGPFTIKDNFGTIIDLNVSRETLKDGISYEVDDNVSVITLCSTGKVERCKDFPISAFDVYTYANTKFNSNFVSCAWTHLKDPLLYNTYYGEIEPYIIEYPFSYQFLDEIVQNVKVYTKVYKYIETDDNVLADYSKYETDNIWFNKAILYNGQQCSGLLNLVPKPKNNLRSYLQYPEYGPEGKVITYTKNDNFYQYNTFWNVTEETSIQQFVKSCESLSIDKVLNQDNMDYNIRTRKKETLRAKELKVRHILDNRGDVNLVSQFIITPAQNSYK